MPAGERVRHRSPAPVSESLRRLGERLRKARTEAGLSQTQLGAPHFTRAYVSALELGKIRPAMRSLEFLAGKLGKPPSYFLDDEDQERKRRERDVDIGAAAALLTRSTAAQALERIRELLENASVPEEICRLRLMAGTAHNFLAHGTDAMRELTVGDRLATQLGKLDLKRQITHQTAIALRTLGELTRSRSLLVGLLEAADKSGTTDQILRMRLLKDLGAVNWDLGEYENANAYYESALQLAQDVGDIAGLTSIYNGLALTKRGLGDLEGATAYLQKALGATQVSNDLATAAILHNALAVIAGERGHIDAAYRHADRAIELAKVAGPQAYVAHYLNTKAEAALRAGRQSDAGRFAGEALDVARQTENVRAAASARTVLAEVAMKAGSTTEAVDRLEEAAASYRKVGAKQELGEVLIRLSEIAGLRGDADAARRYAEQAYQATKATSGLMGR